MGGSCVLVRSPYPRFQRAAGPTCYVTVRLVLFITRDGELISSAGVLSPNVPSTWDTSFILFAGLTLIHRFYIVHYQERRLFLERLFLVQENNKAHCMCSDVNLKYSRPVRDPRMTLTMPENTLGSQSMDVSGRYDTGKIIRQLST